MADSFKTAHDILVRLESRWISLFLWCEQESGISAEEMIKSLGDAGIEVLTRYAKQISDPRYADFSPFHFLSFSHYPALMKNWFDTLSGLGDLPRDWNSKLNKNRYKTNQYRNDLQHPGRFALLAPDYQQEAIALLGQQLEFVTDWWPDLPVESSPMDENLKEGDPIRVALNVFSAEPGALLPLTEVLGFEPIRHPQSLISASEANDLNLLLREDVVRLFRVGTKDLGSGNQVGLYVAYMHAWPDRSAERERMRRRLARALTGSGLDARYLLVMASNQFDADDSSLSDLELIYPRQRPGEKHAHGTVRAVISPQSATRHQIDLIRELAIPQTCTLPELVKRWNAAFNVEKVTNLFYDEFRELRNDFAEALLEHNREHPTLGQWNASDLDRNNPGEELQHFSTNLHAFATRQLSRVLFLWFLQQKGWLGSGTKGTLPGSTSFLTDRFTAVGKEDTYSYFQEELVPLFFEGVGRSSDTAEHKAYCQQIGLEVPYLNGGLFRADSDDFERELFGIDPKGGNDRRLPVNIPNDLFDPALDEATVQTGRGRSRRQRTLLGMLRSYRFTTQESTPDDQSVDPDPELLGKVFENLYQEMDRKKNGAYYTPRELVQFMCQQSLDGYLRDHANVEQETIDALRLEALDRRETDLTLDYGTETALTNALEQVRVVDPAVGSGAFLVGMMQEIVRLRRGIAAAVADRNIERTSGQVHDWKRHVITHNLHGVDIQPTAVEICRLRLWLSLVIDLEAQHLRDITPLPNLDFRIFAGDSLVDRMGEAPFFESLGIAGKEVVQSYESGNQRNALETAWNAYLLEEAKTSPDAATLRQLEGEIRASSKAIARAQVDDQLIIRRRELDLLKRGKSTSKKRIAAAEEIVATLEAFHENLLDPHPPFQKPFLWPLAFIDLFKADRPLAERGFDIVIANPPYVRQEKLDPIDQKSYAAAFPDVSNGTADLYVLFFSRALQLLKVSGWLAFVTSNKYMRANYGEGLRETLPKRLEITDVIDFGDLPVFSVAAYPAVVIGRKHNLANALTNPEPPDPNGLVTVADLTLPVRKRLKEADLPASVENVRNQLEQLDSLIEQSAAKEFPRALLRGSGWILEDPVLIRLFDRLMNEGTPLGKYVNGRIYRGVLTGFNEAFVIDQAKRDELVAADPRSAELIKPWLRGRDIKRWKPDWDGLYVIFARRGVDIEAYPAILEHLGQWRERLTPRLTGENGSERRKPGKYKWFEIQDVVGYWQEFEKPKILWPDIAIRPRFAFDSSRAFLSNTAYFSSVLDLSDAALLNSPIGALGMAFLSPAIRGGYRRYFTQYLETFPMPSNLAPDMKDALIIASDSKNEQAATELAFKAYKLNNRETGAVNSFLSLQKDLGFEDDSDSLEFDDQ